jgi:L-lactate dehydrogenase (cytochrome)
VDRAQRRLARAPAICDLRELARRRLLPGVFDYVDGGAESEWSLRANAASFEALEFDPRVLAGVADIDTSVVILGERWSVPFGLAPIGMPGFSHPDAEVAAVRAAHRAGVPFTHATMGSRSIEEVAAAANPDQPLWFQLYVWRDRDLVEQLMSRARACGFTVLVVTADTPVFGRRRRDVRNGFSLPPKLRLSTFIDGALHPAWTWRFLTDGPVEFGNLGGRGSRDASPVALADFVNASFDPSFGWADLAWVRSHWPGPILLKGVQSARDVAMAADHGMNGVILSNHGGRQLDYSPPPLSLLPAVAERHSDDLAILVDGGIRSGGDVVKALALGAHACLVGRAWAYGLGAAGEAGVAHAIDLLQGELRRTMALIGVSSVAELTRDNLKPVTRLAA